MNVPAVGKASIGSCGLPEDTNPWEMIIHWCQCWGGDASNIEHHTEKVRLANVSGSLQVAALVWGDQDLLGVPALTPICCHSR